MKWLLSDCKVTLSSICFSDIIWQCYNHIISEYAEAAVITILLYSYCSVLVYFLIVFLMYSNYLAVTLKYIKIEPLLLGVLISASISMFSFCKTWRRKKSYGFNPKIGKSNSNYDVDMKKSWTLLNMIHFDLNFIALTYVFRWTRVWWSILYET